MRDWIARIEVTAYGEMGLMPWQVMRMTPREIRLRWEGYLRAEERRAHLVAWMVQDKYRAYLTPRTILRSTPTPPQR